MYSHEEIGYQDNFIDPTNNDVHVPDVKDTWMRVKRKLHQFRKSDNLLVSDL